MKQKKRVRFDTEEKANRLKQHLVEKKVLSDV